jgi:hypothetical protein
MKGEIMVDMTLPRPDGVPALDFDTLAAKLKEEEVRADGIATQPHATQRHARYQHAHSERLHGQQRCSG